MAATEAQKRASNKYIKEKTKVLPVKLRRDYYEEHIEPVIRASGLSPTAYAKQALIEKAERDTKEEK